MIIVNYKKKQIFFQILLITQWQCILIKKGKKMKRIKQHIFIHYINFKRVFFFVNNP